MFELGDPPDYEPGPDDSIAARAQRSGLDAHDLFIDLLLGDEGRALLYVPFLNYFNGNLDAAAEMIAHPHTVPGLSDGGAHVGTICDASFPTSLLTHWGRDPVRGARNLRSRTWFSARAEPRPRPSGCSIAGCWHLAIKPTSTSSTSKTSYLPHLPWCTTSLPVVNGSFKAHWGTCTPSSPASRPIPTVSPLAVSPAASYAVNSRSPDRRHRDEHHPSDPRGPV